MICGNTMALTSYLNEQDRMDSLRQIASEDLRAELEIEFDTNCQRVLDEFASHDLAQTFSQELAELLYLAGQCPGSDQAQLTHLTKINELAEKIKGWCIETVMEKS